MPPGTLAPDFDRGRRIGKYEILTRLSMGGMAELFLAYVAGPGGFRKYVAVKQILPDIKKDESFVKMFLDEARITAAFSHSNIGQVYDLGEEQGELYLAMEFLSGQNLEQIIKRAAKREVLLPIGFACRVVRDSVLGLHYAHHFTDQAGRPAPVVHRDVSPKNVMVTYTGDVKMIDFGIAKARNRLNRTQVGIVKGTSGYMSPEQVKNEPLDGRTDLFAAAVFLHEMLTAQRLFAAPNDAAMMMKIVDGEVQLPKNLNPKVSGALSDVVMKGLARKRENRFSTGKEFAKAIEQACPELFDEDQSAALMTQLFEDKIQTTRALLELANTDDTGSLTKAVQELASEDLESSTPKGRKAASRATPAPRPGLPKKATMSKQNLRPIVDDPPPPRRNSSTSNRDIDATMPPKSRTPSNANLGANRYASKVNRDYAMYDEPEVPTDTSSSKKPFKSSKKLPEITGDGTDTHRGHTPKKGGFGGILMMLLFVGLIGGLGWATWAGPLKHVGVFAALRTSIDKELNGEPPAPPPPSLADQMRKPGGPKPQWVLDKEIADKAAAEEAARRAEMDAAANDPDRVAMLAELDSQIKQLDKLEDEQRKLKLEASTSKALGTSNSKRIDDLEKQIADLKGAIDVKKANKARKTGNGVEVVKDSKTAKNADVGFLSLRTINPSSAAVFNGGEALGSTPLTRHPMDVGVHRLRIVDGDAKNRTLSVTIEAGKVSEMKAVDVQSLPLQ